MKVVSIGITRRLYHDEHAPKDAEPTQDVPEGALCQGCGEPVGAKGSRAGAKDQGVIATTQTVKAKTPRKKR